MPAGANDTDFPAALSKDNQRRGASETPARLCRLSAFHRVPPTRHDGTTPPAQSLRHGSAWLCAAQASCQTSCQGTSLLEVIQPSGD
jgi:hypothetical protein